MKASNRVIDARWLSVAYILFAILTIRVMYFSGVGAAGANIFFAQNSAGANTGADCADARAWSTATSGDWSGNTVHTCGTFTATINTTAIQVKAGNSTLKFEPGAVLTSPAWPAFGGAIDTAGFSNVTIDGGGSFEGQDDITHAGCGTGCGSITSTANGDALANQLQSLGISSSGSFGTNNVVKGLSVGPLYIRVQNNNNGPSTTPPSDDGYCIHFGSTGSTATHNTVLNCATGIVWGDCSNNITISYNHFQAHNHGTSGGCSTGTTAADNLKVIGNQSAGGYQVYDQAPGGRDDYHRDVFIFICESSANPCLTNVTVANNYIFGTYTHNGNMTADIFLDDEDTNQIQCLAYNNILAHGGATDDGTANGYVTGGRHCSFYNNTLAPVIQGSSGFNLSVTGGTVVLENNVSIAPGLGMFAPSSGTGATYTWDFNTWYQITSQGGGSFMFPGSGSCCNPFGGAGSLQAAGFDTHGQNGANPNLVGLTACQSGTITSCAASSGSPILAFGTNLTSLGITGLNSDILGNARPTGSTKWTAGAIQGTLAGSVSLTPSPESFGSLAVGVSGSPVTFTVLNTNSTTATAITPSVSGGNTADFAIVNSGAGSCSAAGGSLATSASCTFTVTFTPGGTGSRSTTLSVSYSGGDGASPQTSALSGTGTTSAATGTKLNGGIKINGGVVIQ
jgi:hypothetical protein